MERTDGRPAQGDRPDPRACARTSGRNVKVLGSAEQPQPVAGEGRPGRRLLRARRADVHRRPATAASPAAATSAPSRRPRTARRCATTTHYAYVAAWEWAGEDEKPGPAQGGPDLRVRRDEAAELQVSESDPEDLAPARRRVRRARCTPTQLDDVSPDMSFLEMLDVLNEQLNAKGEEPVAFDSDCREGICGMCGLMINGQAHGPEVTTTCQLHMRSFEDGDDDHHRAVARRRVPGAQGPGRRPRAPSTGSSSPAATSRSTPARRPTPTRCRCRKDKADRAFDAATCIGCGACVAACPNGSASLFLGAKITHLGELPQGQAERDTRVVNMVAQHDARGLRRLHQHRRVHRRLPQGDPARRDLPAQLGPARRACATATDSSSLTRLPERPSRTRHVPVVQRRVGVFGRQQVS